MAEASGSFITRSFESMLKDSSGKKHANLQKALKAYLDRSKNVGLPSSPSASSDSTEKSSELKAELEKENESAASSPMPSSLTSTTDTNVIAVAALNTAGHVLEGAEAELILLPLRLAFETKFPKLVNSALDCLHKLISYEHLEGDAGIAGGKNSTLVTDMFNMVCAAVDNNASDSTILQVLKVSLIAVASTKFRVHGECILSAIRTCYHIALTSKNPVNQATAKATLTQMISIVFKRMELESQEHGTSSGGGSEASTAIPTSPANEIVLTPDKTVTDESTPKEDVQNSETVSVSVEELEHLAGDADIKGLEAALVKAVHPEGVRKMPEGLDLDNMTVAQQDALTVFRTLCKMAMKEEKDELVTRTRILSLELLQGLLESVSYSFTLDFRFLDSVKAYLCYALLRACVSPVTTIFQLCTNIFNILLLRFRESLKGEIGVFFPLIVLRTLDSYERPLQNRISVLRMLEGVCKDSQMLADIFVNYDCNLEASNLFERMVNALSKTAQASPTADPNNVPTSQNATVKGSSLQCLVNILESLVEWTRTHQNSREMVMDSMSGHKVVKDNLHNDAISDGCTEEEAGSQPDDFERLKAHKSTIEAAIVEFNRKPDRGVDFLITNRLVENSPTAIANFLLRTTGLNKTSVGEYLGQHEEFPLSVMHAYVDSMNFSGMKFDVAIREFLRGFRLPGEAQKIDRIMEKFAERYCRDNPGTFANADAAYILAYAVIMLNTDAHNPMIWPKMTKTDFLRISSGSDIENSTPKEMLEEIYDSIVENEIKLKDDVTASVKGMRPKTDVEDRFWLISILNLGLPRKIAYTDSKTESTDIIRQTQMLFKKGIIKRGTFYKAQQMELVRPMLDVMGWPLLVAFSVILENTDNKSQVQLCMQGFRSGIHLTKFLGMDTMRYAFLTSLVRFTCLHAPKEMKSKNVEALRALLSLSEAEPDALQDTWNAVLECISRLEYITSSPSILNTVMIGSNQVSKDAVAHSLTELAGKSLEQIFVNSVKLPSDAIVEFFTALCGVSAEELKQRPPRHFSLQKLVEISFYNMARIRMVWARIWTLLSQQFVSAGSHQDEKVAMYAIDSLRQLGIKYLERAELTNFTFQNDILKPFVILIRNSRSPTIRSLIVDCIIQMIKSKVGSIKSGWHSVFMIFKAAASDDTDSIAEVAFENMEQVVLEHFDQVVGDCFLDCVHCLIAFANNKSCPRISLKAVALLRICEDRLAEGLIPGGALKPVQIDAAEGLDIADHYWFPMLVGLSDLTSDPRTEVRNCALEVLFDLLQERGHKFSAAFWQNVFRDVLFPIFDSVREAENDAQKSALADAWLRDTCIHSLQLLCNLFSTFYKDVSFMLPSLLSLLLDCATRPDQRVAHISVNALTHLMEVGGEQFDDKDWATILDCLRDACYTTQPVELLSSDRTIYGHGYVKKPSVHASRAVNQGSTVEDLINNELSSSSDAILKLQADGNGPVDSNTVDAAVQESQAGNGEDKDSGGFVRNQTFGKMLMDTILLKNVTFKGRSQDNSNQLTSSDESEDTGGQVLPLVDETLLFPTSVRSKCMAQLLFLGAIDNLQKKHWTRLHPNHKLLIMDVILSMVDFAASYNSYKSLQLRIQQFSADRPPPNLLRQEIQGTEIYLTILNRTITECEPDSKVDAPCNGSLPHEQHTDDAVSVSRTEDLQVRETAEQKLVSFCLHILKAAATMQPIVGDVRETDSFLAATLRSPVVVKVLHGMSKMKADVFTKHLSEFYPFFTKLICSEQVEVRRALSELFKLQLISNLP